MVSARHRGVTWQKWVERLEWEKQTAVAMYLSIHLSTHKILKTVDLLELLHLFNK